MWRNIDGDEMKLIGVVEWIGAIKKGILIELFVSFLVMVEKNKGED